MPLYQPPDVNRNVLSQFSLKGKVAAVTGGAKGIGLEIVRGLAEAGADVALIYSSNASAHESAAAIAAANGVRVQAYKSDVTTRSTIAATLNQAPAGLWG